MNRKIMWIIPWRLVFVVGDIPTMMETKVSPFGLSNLSPNFQYNLF